VAGGVYPENIRVQEKAVRLYGGYAGGTKADYAAGAGGNFKVRDPAVHSSHLKGNGDAFVAFAASVIFHSFR